MHIAGRVDPNAPDAPACGARGKRMTRNLTNVTCRRCLALLEERDPGLRSRLANAVFDRPIQFFTRRQRR